MLQCNFISGLKGQAEYGQGGSCKNLDGHVVRNCGAVSMTKSGHGSS